MAIEVETKDCTALSDAELAELADLCADGAHRFEIGTLTKQAELWVLVTTAREAGRLRGFSFCTLERIGGTPSVLVGLASVKRGARREAVLRAIMTDQLRRAVLAFPDEDVLVGARIDDPGAFEAFKPLNNVVPRPGHRASGEERAWGRRLVKRFGIDPAEYDDRAFIARGDGSMPLLLDHEAAKPERTPAELAALFDPVDRSRGDVLVAFGWALAEDLEKLI